MIERVVHGNGVVAYRSPLLAAAGVVHGFSTRVGGVSSGVFASLNLGNPSGCEEQDEEGNLRENYRRLQEAIGAGGWPRAWVKQVHGRRVELLEREPEGEYGETLGAELRDRFCGQVSADAMVSAVARVLLSVRVADCVPVLLASGDGKVVGAVHAGWRGAAGDIVGKAVRSMMEVGVEAGEGGAGEIVAAIGPGISAEHFEVGEEVAEEFLRQGFRGMVRMDLGDKPHVDLQGVIREQLLRAGVRRVDGNEVCTFRDGGEFFSHRREKGVTGRMAGVIGVKS